MTYSEFMRVLRGIRDARSTDTAAVLISICDTFNCSPAQASELLKQFVQTAEGLK